MRRRWTTLLVLSLLASGCSTTLRSQVIDATTRQPVAGAVVVGVWTRCEGPLFCRHKLVGVRETETDDAGWFNLERLPSSGLDGEGGGQALTIYKPGYTAWSNLYTFPGPRLREDQRVPSRIPLEPFPVGQSREQHRHFIDGATVWHLSPGRAPRLWKALQEVTP